MNPSRYPRILSLIVAAACAGCTSESPRQPAASRPEQASPSPKPVAADSKPADAAKTSPALEVTLPVPNQNQTPAKPKPPQTNGPQPPILDSSPAGAASVPVRLEDRELDDLFTELLAGADEGRVSVTLVQHLGQRGMAAGAKAAQLATEDLSREARLNALCDVLALAGRMRRQHAELLRLYDPTALDVFYGQDRAAKQQALRPLTTLEKWPRELPAALVTAAPLLALDWLNEQAKSEQPSTDSIRKLCRQWGQWSRQNNERQYTAELSAALTALLDNTALATDSAASIDLLRAAGECHARAAAPAIIKSLTDADPQVRRQAATALGRLGDTEALVAIVARTAIEQDPQVQADLAAALNHWPDDAKAGEALLALFARSDDDNVRREILFTVANAHWPQRTAILQAAFEAPSQGSLGVALLSLASVVPPELHEPTLALAKDLGEANPALIDALGAMKDDRTVPYLIHALQKELNTPLRLKAALALEKIHSPAATVALVEALQTETDPLLVEHLVGIAGNLQLEAAEPTLIALAQDATAPMAIRVQSLWSLGASSSSRARQSIERMSQDPRQVFGNANDPALAATDAERIELASLFLAFARWRQGNAAAETDIEQQFHDGSATSQLSCLMLLARLQRDHAVIAKGLDSHELPILLAAVRAAGAADARKYHESLVKLRQSLWIERLLASSADTLNLGKDLDAAIAAGEKAK